MHRQGRGMQTMPPPCSRLYFAGTERRGPGFIRLICVLLSKIIIKVWSGIVNLREPLTFSSGINLHIYTTNKRNLKLSVDPTEFLYESSFLYILHMNVFLSFILLFYSLNNYLLFFDGSVLLDDGMVD